MSTITRLRRFGPFGLSLLRRTWDQPMIRPNPNLPLCFTSVQNNPFIPNHPARSLSSQFGDNDNEEESDVVPPRPLVLDSLTEEIQAKLVGNITARKFKLRLIEDELTSLMHKEFPLPDTLGEEQWTLLMEFRDREFRTRYLDAIVAGKDNPKTLAELKEKDDKVAKGIEFTTDMFEEVADPEDDLESSVDKINLAYNEMRQMGENVPYHLTFMQKRELLKANSISAIWRILRYFGHLRQEKVNALIKKRVRLVRGVEKKKEILAERENFEHIIYGLGHNTIFLRLLDRTMDRIEQAKIAREFNEWGQPLVIDLQFIEHMDYKQAKSLMYREIMFGLNRNKKAKDPFPVYITSFNPNCDKCNLLIKCMPNIADKDYPLVVTEKHFTEIFPKERLVYMSPDSKSDLLQYDGNDIYVIGGLVEGSSGIARTLAEAKKRDVRHARLPMRKFIGLTQELNVDHMISILSDFKHTQDWFYSFRWVPSRVFRNRIVSRGYDLKSEAIYKAHFQLSPHTTPMETLSPKEYRKQYAEIMTQILQQSDDKSTLFSSPTKRYQNVSDMTELEKEKFERKRKHNTSYEDERERREKPKISELFK